MPTNNRIQMEIIVHERCDYGHEGEVYLEYRGLTAPKCKVYVTAYQSRKGWDVVVQYVRQSDSSMRLEQRTFKERTMLTKWIKSNFAR